ncbi:MAG: nucleotidyl transferase AbiEii/AbiGii toxin family protein [Parvibaculaceae bacterium]
MPLICGLGVERIGSDDLIPAGYEYRIRPLRHRRMAYGAPKFGQPGFDRDTSRVVPEMDALRSALDPWLGAPRWKQTESRVTFVYRFGSEDTPPLGMRLKVEINSREHFAVHGFMRQPFGVSSRWYEGACDIQTYGLDELLGTKLRALYQRKKGRDLFDLAVALEQDGIDSDRIIDAFTTYMDHGGHGVTRALFEQNMHRKLSDPLFTAGIGPLLAPGYSWNLETAAEAVNAALIRRLPGDPWKDAAED